MGGSGNDTLYAGTGACLLIAGTGTSTFYGGSGNDMLIGGSTSYDANDQALAGHRRTVVSLENSPQLFAAESHRTLP